MCLFCCKNAHWWQLYRILLFYLFIDFYSPARLLGTLEYVNPSLASREYCPIPRKYFKWQHEWASANEWCYWNIWVVWAILERRERWIDITSALLNKTNICQKSSIFPIFSKKSSGSQNSIRAEQTASLEISALPAGVTDGSFNARRHCEERWPALRATHAGKAESSSEAVCYALMLFCDPGWIFLIK